jgi:hypothetical protein
VEKVSFRAKNKNRGVRNMARGMKWLAVISFVLTAAFAVWYAYASEGVLLSFAITFGTFFYHFAMRLAVGHTLNAVFRNKMDFTKPWFCERKFEKKLYRLLRVRVWRKHVPTYAPETFSRELHSWREIAMATCQAEIVHEVIVLFSFVPILFAIPFGALPVFVITSVISALFDMIFVILQRYNRPMLLRVMAAEERKR